MQWLMPSEGGYLEAEGLEKTWRIKQEAIAHEVDISASRKQYDIILPGTNEFFILTFQYFGINFFSGTYLCIIISCKLKNA